MKVFSLIHPSLRRNLMTLFVVGLLFWASLAALLPTLSLYIKDIGATSHQVGIVMGSFAIGLLAFRPWVGQLADQRDRKVVLLIGLFAAALGPIGYLFSHSVPSLMAIRALHGLSIAAFTTGYSALVVDFSPPQHRGELLGYMSLVNPVGMALGPALGGFVHEWAGYTLLFLVAAGLGFLGLVGALQIQNPPAVPKNQADDRSTRESFWRMVSSPRLRIPTLVLLLIGLAFGTLSTFVPLFIKQTGVDLNPGLFYTAAAIASFAVRVPAGPASDRYGRGRFISFSLLLYTASMLLLWLANSAAAFLVAAALEGAGAGIFIPTTIAMIADRAHADERGRVFSLCMAGFDLGIAIAGPTLGFFAETIGYRGLFGLAGGLAFLAFVLFISLGSKNLPASLRFALAGGKDVYALSPAGGDRSH